MNDAAQLFERLKEILEPYESELTLVRDKPDDYYLDAGKNPKNGKPYFFGAVQIRKHYVSFHLMPVYLYPELLENISRDLKRRMQGKSCFNFRRSDEPLIAELEDLVRAGFQRYQEDGLV
ncbi:MAG: hypothetical protein ACOC25_05770 [Alkalispirochaetaceae bacterium]